MVSGTEYMSSGMGFIALHTDPTRVSLLNAAYQPRVSREKKVSQTSRVEGAAEAAEWE